MLSDFLCSADRTISSELDRVFSVLLRRKTNKEFEKTDDLPKNINENVFCFHAINEGSLQQPRPAVAGSNNANHFPSK